MGMKAVFSNRIYKITLPAEYMNAIDNALFVFNRAKQFAFSTLVKEKRSGLSKRTKSVHLTVWFGRLLCQQYRPGSQR
ncbi:hypothetical protein [Bacillus sp. FJAT-27445]|uniref:hypothetical protein n=1 Tax=Bacillus sp. FJAT-27445 TaxID=1679166 RepID=UPI0012E3BF8E|nr:hypothetical protein [Bacillus sp. FJAT-27445]